ncbi:homocitrate synthase [Drechmeria coniospora]|uniref:Homocitrate synthase n=1 Tax=Drechmeria coniospora TaxID=98403 RepID=A0A151GE04_DRECN|nr:homocitrate synthase [Drechmeria coniospora]KYK55324.1 homocitrate synthase [Drechmeria coniospora]
MPLHLLGKKSWHVYNADNVARVRRDEAAAKAAEEAEEQRMQEIDGQRRLAILRGEAPPPLDDEPEKESPKIPSSTGRARGDGKGGTRRARKRHGEDDTDFELRLARERNEVGHVAREAANKSLGSVSIVDDAGHIDLLGDERRRAQGGKNQEAEEESRKKQREYEDQYRMRLSSAGGKDGVNQKPWYSHTDLAAVEAPSKNAFGNEDPRRKERDAMRLATNDPLLMMKQGSTRVRELKRERRDAELERQKELKQLRRENRRRDEERRRQGRSRRHRSRSPSPVTRRLHRQRSRSRSPVRRSHRESERSHERRDDEEQRHGDRSRRRDEDSRRRRRSSPGDGERRAHGHDG